MTFLSPSILWLIGAMAVELIPSRLNDNLTMPIFSGLIMMYLETIL